MAYSYSSGEIKMMNHLKVNEFSMLEISLPLTTSFREGVISEGNFTTIT
ncbi:MAG: hypothetical protein ABIS36_20440 [Chryseolinea sp.]